MWPNPQENADMVTFPEEILNGKLHFCTVEGAAKIIDADITNNLMMSHKHSL